MSGRDGEVCFAAVADGQGWNERVHCRGERAVGGEGKGRSGQGEREKGGCGHSGRRCQRGIGKVEMFTCGVWMRCRAPSGSSSLFTPRTAQSD
jgi:hypothetical protein